MISSLQLIGPAIAGPAVPASGAGEVILIASAGLIGMGLSDIASGIFGDDEGDDAGAEGDGDFAGEGTADDGSLDGDLGGDDDFGDLDGWDDDDDLGEDGGEAAAELEPRLDELENEVASISSSMGTVRSENEAINETVDEIEDNIRKLLDIYEMVTRGVNPFVDDVQGSAGGMEGSFGLFDDAAAPDDGSNDLDPDVANADPDDFFDDEFDDEPADEFDDELDEEMDGDVEAGMEDLADEPESADAGGGEETGGKTFDDLKSEYQSGGADWDEDSDVDPEADVEADQVEAESVADSGEQAAPPEDPSIDDVDDAGSEAVDVTGDGSADTTANGDGKPYLDTLPGGYASELLVIEWLTYLRDSSGTAEALRAIRYYETIGWIGGPAAETLQRYLTGLGQGEKPDGAGGETQLTIDHHTNSLRYIGRLGGADVDVERLEWGGSSPARNRIERRGQRGIQR